MSLPQGTYVIYGGNYVMFPDHQMNSGPEPVVITGENPPFKWDVLHPLQYITNDQFTIEVYDEDEAYAKPRKSQDSGVPALGHTHQKPVLERVYIDRDQQVYEIINIRDNFYKIYLPGRKYCLKWMGKDQPVVVVADSKTDDNQLIWRFINANGPYEAFGAFFVQDTGPNSNKIKIFPHFGLLPLKNDSKERWSNFWAKINQLNKDGKGLEKYKVFFLGRHGQAVNNILNQLENVKEDDDVEKRDTELTQEGCLDAMNAHSVWIKEQTEANIGLPHISYCSPLSRTLLTNTLTFGTEVYGDSPHATVKMQTIVVENCRERCTDREWEHRRSKSYIKIMFPMFKFEDGFKDEDPFWYKGDDGIEHGLHETMKQVRARVREVLHGIFSNDGATFVSITTHSGFIEAFLRVVERGPYEVPNGTVLPLVCKYTPAKD